MKKYKYLTKNKKVCGGRTIVKNTRIEPIQVVEYGTFDEVMEDFNLTKDEVIECYHYIITKKLQRAI